MEKNNWSIHLEFAVLFVTLIGGFYTLDAKIERATQAQSQRTDRLYEMFYEVIKETRK